MILSEEKEIYYCINDKKSDIVMKLVSPKPVQIFKSNKIQKLELSFE